MTNAFENALKILKEETKKKTEVNLIKKKIKDFI